VSPRKAWARIESGNFDLRFDDLLRLAQAFGFQLARIRGSHHILLHSELPLMLNLQPARVGQSGTTSSSSRWQFASTG
jgi:predicted RNA binding protein YcfA (HicA-like mRNA interferase family)